MHRSAPKENSSQITTGIIGGTLSLTVGTLIVKFLGLIYKIPLAAILGDLGMGYFNSAYTVYAFFYLLCTAGVPKAVMILVSEAKAKGSEVLEGKIIRVATTLFLVFGALITLIFVIFSYPLATLIGNSRSAFTMIAIAPSIIFVSLSGVIRGYLNAEMKLSDIAISQVIEGVGRLVLGLAFAMLGNRLNMPLEMLSAMTILGVTLGAAAGFIYLLICSKIKIKRDNIGQSVKITQNSEIIKRILHISIPITISAAIMSITGIIDLGLIINCLGKIGYSESEATALYGNYTTLAVPMLNLAISIITPISVAHMPLLTRSFLNADNSSRRSLERGALELTAIAAAPMMIGMCVYSKEILSLLFPNSDVGIGAPLLSLLSPSILFFSLLMIVNTILEAAGRVSAPMISMLLGSLAKIILSYILITHTELGILGAPIGSVICYATALFTSLIIYGRSIKAHLPIFSTCAPAYLSALTAVLCSRYLYIKLFLVFDERVLLLISIVFCALIYLVLLTFIGILSPKRLKEIAKYTKIPR